MAGFIHASTDTYQFSEPLDRFEQIKMKLILSLFFHRKVLSDESVVYGEANLPAKHLPAVGFALHFCLPGENWLSLQFSFLPLGHYTKN